MILSKEFPISMICLWLFRTLLSQQIYEREITLYSQRDWYLVPIQAVPTIVNVSMTKNIFSFDFLHLRQEIWCNIWANWSVWLYWLGVCAMMSTIVELTMLFKQSMYLFLYLCMPSDNFFISCHLIGCSSGRLFWYLSWPWSKSAIFENEPRSEAIILELE